MAVMEKGIRLQNDLGGMVSPFFVGLYGWIVAVFFGTVLLDIAYSNYLRDLRGATEVATVFSDVSDFLLVIGFLVVLAAIGAIVFSWKIPAARNCFIASLIILLAEFLGPAFLSGFVLESGYWIRLAIHAAASMLAFIGLYLFYRQR
jgi:hypothetical protein